VRTLIKRPFVQLVLATALIGQVAAVGAAGTDDVSARDLIIDPVVVTARSGIQTAWLGKAILRESERIGAEYRTRGFSVSPQLARQIGVAAAEFEIDPAIAFGLVRAESSFRNAATSPVGAIGLTQLMPRTASWMEPGITRAELRDPETNLRIGFKYLRYLLDKYEGDERLALIAYNRGPGTVDNALQRGRDPDNGYADFVNGKEDHAHRLFSR
jgi:soluble lytic murein transglycosylase-like protein